VDSLRGGLIVSLVAASVAYGVQLRDPIGAGLFVALLFLPRNFALFVRIRRMHPTVGAGLLALSLLLPIPDYQYVSGDWSMAFAHLAMFLAAWKIQHRRLTVGDSWFLFALAFFIALMSTGGARDPFFAPLLAFYTVISVVVLTLMSLRLEEQRVLDLARVRGYERPKADEVAGRETAPRRAAIASLRHLSFWLIALGFFIWWATPHVISGVGGAFEFILYGDREDVATALPEVEDEVPQFEIPEGVVALPPFGNRLERDEFIRRRNEDRLALLVRATPGSTGYTRDLRVRGECYDYLSKDGRWIRARRAERRVYDGEDGSTDGKVRLLAAVPGVAVELEYLVPPGRDRTIYVTPVPVQVDLPRLMRDGTGNLRVEHALAVPRDYVALSSLHEPAFDGALTEPGPEFLLLPGDLDRETIDAILTPLTAHLTDPLHRVQAILTWLRRKHVRYEEDERVVGPEAVLQKAPVRVDVAGFLGERKWGRDIDFASAAAVLLRADGIPCRLATGYCEGFFLSESGFFVFRSGDLRAWVEVPFAGLGWVPFEASPMDVDELDPDAVDDIFSSPEEERADEAAAAIEESLSPTLLRQVLDAIDKFVSGLVPGGEDSTAAGRLLAWLIVLSGLLLSAWALYRGSHHVGVFFHRQREGPRGESPRFPFYDRLLGVLARYGYRRRPAETPMEFARAVAGARERELIEVVRLTKVFCAMRYGRMAVSRERVVELVGRVAAVERQLVAREPEPAPSGPGMLSLIAVLLIGLAVGPVIAQVEVYPEKAVEELSSRDPGRRRSARESLVGLGSAAVPILLGVFDEPRSADREAEIRTLVGMLDDPDFRVRDQAVRKLSAIGMAAKKALLEVVKSGRPEARHRARGILDGIVPPSPAEVAAARAALEMRRVMALRVLGRVGDAGEIEPVALIGEVHPGLRAEAARALAAIGRRRPRAFLLLLERPRPEMRRLAATALGFWPAAMRRDHLLRLVADQDPETRRVARRGLVTPEVVLLTDGARLALRAGRLTDAGEKARAALGSCPGYGEAGLILLDVLLRRKRFGEALHLARGLDLPEAERSLVTAKPLYLLGRHTEAIEALDLAYRARPGFTVALLEAARIHLGLGQDGAAAALRLIDRAIVTSRFEAEPWAMRGFVLAVHLNQLERARSAYERALSLDPGNSEYEIALRRLRARPR